MDEILAVKWDLVILDYFLQRASPSAVARLMGTPLFLPLFRPTDLQSSPQKQKTRRISPGSLA